MSLRSVKNNLVGHFNNIQLRNKLILSFSVLIIIAVLLSGILSVVFSRKFLLEAEEAYLVKNISQLNTSLDYFFEVYMDRTNQAFMSDEVQSLMNKKIENISDAIYLDKEIQLVCSSIENDYKYPEMKNSYYFGGNISYKFYLDNDQLEQYGCRALPMKPIKKEKWFVELSKESRTFKWGMPQMINEEPAISLSRRLIHFDDSKVKGVLQIFIPVQRIEGILNTNNPDKLNSIFLVDENFQRITQTGNSLYLGESYLQTLKDAKLTLGVNRISIGNHEFLSGILHSESTGWNLIYLAPIEEITKKTNLMILISSGLVVIAFILCVLMAYTVSSFITRRIKLLVKKSIMIGDNNLKTDISLQGNDELGQLDKQFDQMIYKIDSYIENEYKYELTINQVKLELFQEQINPHLLYNTLAMVAYTSKKAGNQEIVEIAEKLSAFYKGILSRGKIISTFKEELNMVSIYIDLMRYVYNLKIDVILDMDEKINDLYTIKLLLQPVVENAIIHGIKPKKAGMLVLNAQMKENFVELTISDDGMGMEEKQIDELNSINSYTEIDRSYGISNIVRRIKLFFGNEYGVAITSVKGEGTIFRIKLPILSKSEIENHIYKNKNT